MKLVDYGDSNTRSQLDAGNEATVIIASIEPRSLGSFLTYFEELRFTIATLQDFKLQEEKEIEDRIRNEIVGKKIIRNALLCFKRSLGSEDFLALNEKDFLAEKDIGNKIFNIATKWKPTKP